MGILLHTALTNASFQPRDLLIHVIQLLQTTLHHVPRNGMQIRLISDGNAFGKTWRYLNW